MATASPYDSGFFSGHRAGSRSSAQAILPPLLEALRPRSVVDVGCGTGTWLAVAGEAGVEEIAGVDGPWVDPRELEIPAPCFRAADLETGLSVTRRFDLAICMETAEHLPPARAERLVAELAALAPVVLFSAAIPGQGGVNHVNERWPDYWSELFAARGMRRLDAVRPRHWDDERVSFWYAQNAFVYAAPGAATGLRARATAMPLRAVHPDCLSARLDPALASREFVLAAVRRHLRAAARWYSRAPLRAARGALRSARAVH